MKCHQQDCPFIPVFRYTWAGQGERVVCALCARRVAGLAGAIGYYVQFIPLVMGEVNDA